MAEFPEPGDEELLVRMRCGEEAAFVSLYRRRQGAIYRFAFHMTGSASAAEDVTQEVFLALIRRGCAFDAERGTLLAYLFGIARKLALRYLDRNRALAGLEGERPQADLAALRSADPMVDLMRREGLEQLRRAVLSLPKRYREVVVLCDLEEMDYAAAAAVLDCPLGTVRSRLHRARALLLEKLAQKGQDSSLIQTLKPARSVV